VAAFDHRPASGAALAFKHGQLALAVEKSRVVATQKR
jgi:hypothetical protein